MQQIQKFVYVDALLNPLSGKARRCALLYYILLCLMADDFTCQGRGVLPLNGLMYVRHKSVRVVRRLITGGGHYDASGQV